MQVVTFMLYGQIIGVFGADSLKLLMVDCLKDFYGVKYDTDPDLIELNFG